MTFKYLLISIKNIFNSYLPGTPSCEVADADGASKLDVVVVPVELRLERVLMLGDRVEELAPALKMVKVSLLFD